MSYRGVLLDLYQTLLYSEPTGIRERAADAVEASGVGREAWLSAWRATRDRSDRGEVATILDRVHMALSGAGLSDPPAGLADRVAGMLLVSEYPVLYPDTRRALAALRERAYRLALVSNWSACYRNWVTELELDRLFDCLIFSFDVGALKPEPEIYHAAAEHLGVPAQECVLVDDLPENLQGARSLGVTAVRIDRPNRADDPPQDDSHDARVADLQELLNWLPAKAGDAAPGKGQR